VSEEMPEAEDEEGAMSVEQGEPQSLPLETIGPSQESDDGESPNLEVRRSEQGWI